MVDLPHSSRRGGMYGVENLSLQAKRFVSKSSSYEYGAGVDSGERGLVMARRDMDYGGMMRVTKPVYDG